MITTYPVIATIDQLIDHLKLPKRTGSPPSGPNDDDLQMKLDAATQLVLDYIEHRHPADPEWTRQIEEWSIDPLSPGSPATVPPPVVILAVLEQAAEFYRFRGDDPSTDQPGKSEYGCLSKSIEGLLFRYTNRAFA